MQASRPQSIHRYGNKKTMRILKRVSLKTFRLQVPEMLCCLPKLIPLQNSKRPKSGHLWKIQREISMRVQETKEKSIKLLRMAIPPNSITTHLRLPFTVSRSDPTMRSTLALDPTGWFTKSLMRRHLRRPCSTKGTNMCGRWNLMMPVISMPPQVLMAKFTKSRQRVSPVFCLMPKKKISWRSFYTKMVSMREAATTVLFTRSQTMVLQRLSIKPKRKRYVLLKWIPKAISMLRWLRPNLLNPQEDDAVVRADPRLPPVRRLRVVGHRKKTSLTSTKFVRMVRLSQFGIHQNRLSWLSFSKATRKFW